MMKKMMMLAAMAMMTAVASAVTVNWSAVLKGGNGTSGGWCGLAIFSGVYDPTATGTALNDILTTDTSARTATLTTAFADNDAFIGFANTNISGPWAAASYHTAVGSGVKGGYGPLLADEANFDDSPTNTDGLAGDKSVKGSFTLDDSATAFTVILFNDYMNAYHAQTYYITDAVDFTEEQDLGVIQWTQNSSTEGGGNQTYSTVVLPEPTALALLALGVAGLALKRKVA